MKQQSTMEVQLTARTSLTPTGEHFAQIAIRCIWCIDDRYVCTNEMTRDDI
jgi:hypothetical protein